MKKRLLSLLLAVCVMIAFMPAANMEETTNAESEVFADDFVGFSADDETDVVGDSLDEEISEVEMVLGDEEDYGLVYEDVIPVETETASVAEGYSYAKVVVDTANVYADLYSEELLFQIAKDSVILVVDSEAAVRYSVAFNTADGVVEAFMASEDLKELDSDEVAAFYDAIALYDGAVLFNGNIDYPLANVEILEAAAEDQGLTDDEALQIEGEDAEAEEQTDEEPVAMMPMRAMEALAAAAFEITAEPENVVAEVGQYAVFTVEATGAATYQWQYSKNGTTWSNLKSTTDSCRVQATASNLDKFQFRCLLKDEAGNELATKSVMIVSSAVQTFEIQEQPEDSVAEIGEYAIFTVKASGAATYQWQYSKNGTTWLNLKSTTDSCRVQATASNLDKFQFRCVLTSANGDELTTTAVKIVSSNSGEFAIVEEPESIIADIGEYVVFSVKATGAATYQWQYSKNGTAWSNLKSTTDSCRVQATASNRDKFQFRCVLTDGNGNELTTEVVMIVSTFEEEFAIQEEPVDVRTEVGQYAVFTVKATGVATYQWQYSKDGTNWSNLASTTDTSKVKATASNIEKFKFRCVLTDSNGNELITREVMIKGLFGIDEEPVDAKVYVGEYAVFTVKAGGAATYQWQYSKDGANWSNLASTTETCKVKATASNIGKFKFRCLLTDGNGKELTTQEVMIKPAFAIVTEPESVTASTGEYVTFEVKADGAATYQWQYSTNGTTWKNLASTTETCRVQATAKNIGVFKFRCVLTDSKNNELTTQEVMILAPFGIVTEPEDFKANVGDYAEFVVVASGAATYQWQYSKDGTNWSNLASTTDTCRVKATASNMNKFKFRCVLTDGNGNELTTQEVMILGAYIINNVKYELLDDIMTVVGYEGNESSYTVVQEVAGYTVKKIGDSAFENNQEMVSIDLPDTIEVIGKRAFAGCTNLSSMN